MKRNNKGFTLIELLAVVVILAVIAAIASSSIIKTIERSKQKTGDTAKAEIIEIGTAYLIAEGKESVTVQELIDLGYLESNLTNPCTGEKWKEDTKCSYSINKDGEYSPACTVAVENCTEQ